MELAQACPNNINNLTSEKSFSTTFSVASLQPITVQWESFMAQNLRKFRKHTTIRKIIISLQVGAAGSQYIMQVDFVC